MNALEFHQSVLESINVRDANGDGFMTAFPDGISPIPVTVGGKRLVLPTKEILKKSPWDDCIGFNPFSERLTRGESPMLKFMRDAIGIRINNAFGQIFHQLSIVASDKALQKRMGPKVSELLKACPEASDKTVEKARKMKDSVFRSAHLRFISMYLKHGGENGASRTCVVTFPAYEELSDAASESIVGVKLTSAKDKDKERLKGLYEYILGDIESYTYGSDSGEAPYYHALLNSYSMVAARLNDVIGRHKKVLEDMVDKTIPLEWSAGLADFSKFSGQIPSMEGNEGIVIEEEDDKEARPTPFNRKEVVEENDRRERSRDRDDDRGRDRDRDDDRRDRDRDDDRRDRDRDDDPMDGFRRQFRGEDRDSRNSWGTKPSRSSWGRDDDRGRDRDRGRSRSRGRRY